MLAATAFGFCFAYVLVLVLENIPHMIAQFLVSICSSQIQSLMVVSLFLFLVGMTMDTPPAILTLSPLLSPAAQMFDFHPVTFGIIMIVNLGIGRIMPSVSTNMFVATGLAKVRTSDVITKHLLVYVISSGLVMISLMVFLGIIMFLPNLGK